MSRRFGVNLRNGRMRCTPSETALRNISSEAHRILLSVNMNFSKAPTHIAVS